MDLGSEIQKTVRIRISILEILCVPIFRQKRTTLTFFFGPNLPKNGFWGRKLSRSQKSTSGFRISSSKIPCVTIFSQNWQLWIFWPEFGELRNYVRYFGSNNVECCRELGGGWNKLGGGGWSWVEAEMSWVEVDRAGWRWVHGLVIPRIKKNLLLFEMCAGEIREKFVYKHSERLKYVKN